MNHSDNSNNDIKKASKEGAAEVEGEEKAYNENVGAEGGTKKNVITENAAAANNNAQTNNGVIVYPPSLDQTPIQKLQQGKRRRGEGGRGDAVPRRTASAVGQVRGGDP